MSSAPASGFIGPIGGIVLAPDEEAAAVASLAYDSVDTVAAQMAFYAKQRPLAVTKRIQW